MSFVDPDSRRHFRLSSHSARYNRSGTDRSHCSKPVVPDQPKPSESFPREAIPPELLEWARQTFDEEEFLAQVHEMEATGGLQLEDFIAELEARARST